MQGELFKLATLTLRPALLGPSGSKPFIVIGCSQSKKKNAELAKNLYTSDRFYKSIELTNYLNAPYAILSAKHGLVLPNEILQPYDLNLADLSISDKKLWAKKVLNSLRVVAKDRRVTLLTAPEYSSCLVEENHSSLEPLDIVTPWAFLDSPDVFVWLVEAVRMSQRIRDLNALYAWISRQREEGTIFPLGDLAVQAVPKRGVYLFLDRQEPNFLGTDPRIVRIGTHAVSVGSKATLRNRLRNHLGPSSKIGNHRGSIFRLHVGRALLEAAASHLVLPSWGEGQDAPTAIKALEAEHEKKVSDYLEKMEVLLINVDDEPEKNSMRAKMEMQLIALLSEGLQAIDSPSADWLGLKSIVPVIRLSGLWNVRGIGEKYDPFGSGSVSSIIKGA